MGITMGTGRDAGGGGEEGKRKKVELLQEAIHGLLEENRVKQQQQQQQQQNGEEDGSMVLRGQDEDLLSSMLSKLDALEKDVDVDNADPNSSHQDSESVKEVGLGDIAKDLDKMKRQNMITHILLGTVIAMTALWQLHEVSFLLGVQKKLTNPFKSVGDMIDNTLKRGGKPMIDAPPLPSVDIPDVTLTDLPTLVSGNNDD